MEAIRALALDSRRCRFHDGSATERSCPFASIAGVPLCSLMLIFRPDKRRSLLAALGIGGFRGRRAGLFLQPISYAAAT
jgi:hypothetical protein